MPKKFAPTNKEQTMKNIPSDSQNWKKPNVNLLNGLLLLRFSPIFRQFLLAFHKPEALLLS